MTPRFVIASLLLALLGTVSAPAQQQSSAGNNLIAVPQQLQGKLASGRLLFDVSRAMDNAQAKRPEGVGRGIPVAIYMTAAPTPAQLAELAQTGVAAHPETWTPPMGNHPRGFFLADLQPARLNDVLALASVQLLGSAAGANRPMNNVASRAIRANAAWSKGWTGKGVKVGVLDSGIDTSYQNGEFPACFDRKNYSKYPVIDNDVINRITPHGTHVAGTAVGRGILSAANTGNEGLAYRGIAPESCLAFLKIGDDSSAGASDAVIIAALHDAVTTYHARVINLSYGGWNTYHDGSEALEQKADWCYTQGTALAFSAGNSATGSRHAMGTVPANGETDFIEVRSWNIAADQSRLSFNLVWYDGIGVQRKLSLKYFDANKAEITNLNSAPVTESPRGTQSQYTSMKDFLPAGNATFYLKVANASGDAQVYHIYEDWFESTWKNQGSISFQNPSNAYTICGPSTADHAFSIAAYCDRSYWTSALGQMRQYSQALDKLASWSSRGPRVDGRAKPDIAAPGTALISVRDTNTMRTPDNSWVDDDGAPGGDAHYTVMQGTSMAAPVATGAMALVLSKYPTLTPQQVYDSLRLHARLDLYTGTAANNNWGAGKLDLGFLSDMPAPSSGSGWMGVPNGWNSKDVADIVVHPKGIFATVGKPWTNDSTTLFRSTNNGSQWTALKSDVGLVPIALKKSTPADTAIYTAQRFAGRGFKSTNLGVTWTQWGDALDYTSLLFAAGDSLLLAGTYGQGIRYSTDGATTWSAMNAGIPDDAQVPILADGGRGWMYAGVNINGSVKLYRLHRSTMQWSRADSGIDTTKNINACAVAPDGTVFAVVWDRVYRSRDNGATWTQMAILNDYLQSVNAVSNSTVLVGTVGAGVYRSVDTGSTWRSFNEGLTTLNITALRNTGTVYAAGKPGSLFRRTISSLPKKPTLMSPVHNAPEVQHPAFFVWEPNGSTSFVFELSLAEDFSVVHTHVEVTGLNVWRVMNLPVLTKFYWRVRAENDGGISPWSDVWSFTTTELPPATPLQLLPENGIDSLDNPVTFAWVPVQGATLYRIDVATDTLFKSFKARFTSASARYVDTLVGYWVGPRYYWRVRAQNAGGISAWSPTWVFSTITEPVDTTVNDPKLIPTPQVPFEKARNVPVNTQFGWLPPTTPLAYQLQVARDTSFAAPLVDQVLSVPTFTAIALPYYTQLSWRVRAQYVDGWKAYCTPRSFTTTLAGPPLKLPTRYATDVTVNPTFTWDSTAGATAYRVQVSKDQAWGLPVFDTSGVTGLTYRTIGLGTSTQYYWRVFGLNADGQGESSEEWQFTTSSSTGVEDPLLASGVTLEQNYPNPARDVTSIRFRTARAADITIRIYDLFGREVVTLVPGAVQPGTYDIPLDVRSLVPGMYICRLSSGVSVTERPLTILR